MAAFAQIDHIKTRYRVSGASCVVVIGLVARDHTTTVRACAAVLEKQSAGRCEKPMSNHFAESRSFDWMRRTTTAGAVALASVMVASLATTACTGIAGPSGNPLGAGGGQTASPLPNAGSDPGPGSTPTTTPSGDQPVARMHRLTTSQYANSLRDLLGAGVPV